MNNKGQSGFSLIELLLVVVIIGIIAAIAIPSLQKAQAVAQNASALTVIRSISTLQVQFFSRNNRFGRLDEINALQDGSLGIFTAPNLTRGRFTYEMAPPNPTDAELKDSYIVKASRNLGPGDSPYVIQVSESGVIVPILPTAFP